MSDDKKWDKECGGRGKVAVAVYSPVKIVVFASLGKNEDLEV